MQVIQAIADSTSYSEKGQFVYALKSGQQYVLYDHEAQAGVRDQALGPVCRLSEVLPVYQGQPLQRHRILVPFIGGMGDAVVTACCLQSLHDQYPECQIDIACPAMHHELLGLLGDAWRVTDYPPNAADLKQYAYFVTLESIQQYAGDLDRLNHFEIFSKCMHTPTIDRCVAIKLPQELISKYDLGAADYPRIGIAVSKSGNMRSYPADLVLRLAKALLERKAAVFLFGLGAEINMTFPQAPPMLCNLIDKTTTVSSLAAIVSQLDGLVCCDSFYMHLAGVLSVPTAAIFTSTSARIAGGYGCVQPVRVRASCSPCHTPIDRCPLGHSECIVHHHEDLRPERLARGILELVSRRPAASSQIAS